MLLAFNCISGEESQVACLERIVTGEVGRSALRFRLACQRRVVHLIQKHNNHCDFILYLCQIVDNYYNKIYPVCTLENVLSFTIRTFAHTIYCLQTTV